MNPKIHLERDADVAVIVIDNPPVNAGSIEVRRGLQQAVHDVETDPALRAAVIIGGGKTFVAGSDLREFGQPLEAPQLPDVIRAIEQASKPFVAALHGAALGGGFELSLGCDARIASPGTQVGLPEVTLGIVPGAGGTQRVPRLVGTVRAISMICSGERLRADKATALGLIDEVVDGDLRAAAVDHARRLAGKKKRVRDLPVPTEDEAAIDAAADAALRAGKRRPAVKAAIDAIRAAGKLPIDEGLAQERAAFQALRVAPEAFALRHQFFAEREVGKHPDLAGATARPVQQLAVLGAGTMGAGIAISALDAGFDVILLDQDQAALDRGTTRIREHYEGRVAAGKMPADDAAARQARLAATTDWNRLATVDMVIEAVFEEIGIKQDVYRRLDGIVRPGAVLATNTSYLDIDAIGAVTKRPQDVVGLHFFSPANVMRLLEVVQTRDTAPDVLLTGIEVGKRLRKLPVVARNAFGFIGNRVYAAYRKQCDFMLEDGAYPEEVDAALTDFGFAMGFFAVTDLSGLDIAWRIRKSQAATRDPAARYVHIADRLCEAGRLGRKTGAGFYRYDADAKKPIPDPKVRELIDQASAEKGIVRRTVGKEEIQRRAMLAMANEAALLLGEGVARRATDVDVVMVNGYGFPKWEGGPVFWARQRGKDALRADLDWLEKVSGPGFVRGDIELLFD